MSPASDQVHVAAVELVHRGRLIGLVAGAVQLAQLAGAGEALTPGQLYYAVLSACATASPVP